MNIVDLIVAGGIILAAVWGLRVGLVSSFLGIVAVLLAYYFSTEISRAAWQTPGIFFLLYAVGATLIWLLKKVIEVKVLGPVDMVGGLLLSAVKFMLIAAILVQMIMLFPLPDQVRLQIKRSYMMDLSSVLFKRTYPIAESTMPQVKDYVNKTVLPVIKGEKETEITKQASQAKDDIVKTVTATIETITKDLGKFDSRFSVSPTQKIDIKEIISKKSKP